MSKKTRIGAALAVLMIGGFGLAACNSEPAKQETPEVAAPAATPDTFVTASYEVKGFRDAEVRADGEAYTARRTLAHPQGISVVPRENPRALRFSFAVSGDVERVSVYRAGEWTDLPAQQNYSVRFGPGGAFHVLVVPRVGQTATLTVSEIIDCTAVPDGGCPMMLRP
ncbi:MAG TPA: hypothetical protein PLN53_05485 [Terricaulis sp.]|nr:hypothetical protein [Terricaulis sp.]